MVNYVKCLHCGYGQLDACSSETRAKSCLNYSIAIEARRKGKTMAVPVVEHNIQYRITSSGHFDLWHPDCGHSWTEPFPRSTCPKCLKRGEVPMSAPKEVSSNRVESYSNHCGQCGRDWGSPYKAIWCSGCGLGLGVKSTKPKDSLERVEAELQAELQAQPATGPVNPAAPNFSHTQWESLVKETIAQIHTLATLKGGEYSGDTDRLANFRRNARDTNSPMELVWRIYAAKHWDAIGQYIKDMQSGKDRKRMEPLFGRADDLIVYLILFKAMLQESGNG